MRALALIAAATALLASPTKSAPTQKRALDTSAIASQYFGNDAAWYKDRISYFESSDTQLQDVFYYRWKIFRAHQRDLGEKGYISTGESALRTHDVYSPS